MLAASLEDAKITCDAQYLAALQSTSAILMDKVSPSRLQAPLQRMTNPQATATAAFARFAVFLGITGLAPFGAFTITSISDFWAST